MHFKVYRENKKTKTEIMIKIALFGSGNGTNAQRICEYFAGRADVEVACIVYNKKGAYIAERAKKLGIEALYYGRETFYGSEEVVREMQERGVDYIVLAGFLWLVPKSLLEAYPRKIVNIHPALLPKYGGKGMYGAHVHEAVIAHGEKESGITIHIVDDRYDEGTTIFQARCEVSPEDTPESLAAKIHKLEYAHYAETIDRWIHQ